MSLLGALQPAVEAIFVARHERIVAAEVVVTTKTGAGSGRSLGLVGRGRGQGGAPAPVSSPAASAGRPDDRLPTLLVVCVPMETSSGTTASAGPVSGGYRGSPVSSPPALAASSLTGAPPSRSSATTSQMATTTTPGGILHTLEIKSDNQVRLRHSLPLSRLVGTSHESGGKVDLTFDFGASGMFSVQFESNIQREMMSAAIRRLKGSTPAGQKAEGGLAGGIEGLEEATRVVQHQQRRGVFTLEEEEKLLQYIGGEAGLDDTQHFQEALLHQQKSTELRLLQTLVQSSSMWATAKEQVHTLMKDVETVEQRIALHSANLLAKRITIQQIEHDNNTLQRKQRNLEDLHETVKRLKDLLQLEPAAEQCLRQLSSIPDDQLPSFFASDKNIHDISNAMRHMHTVIQDTNLQHDFPIAAVKERKEYFLKQRRIIVFRSKEFLFTLIEKYEKQYLEDNTRWSRGKTLVWKPHDELHRVMLQMSEIIKAMGRIDMEGFTSLLRRYRLAMRRVYAVEINSFYSLLEEQIKTLASSASKRAFLLGEPHSFEWCVGFRSEMLPPGDALPPRGSMPLPSPHELTMQVPPTNAAAGGLNNNNNNNTIPFNRSGEKKDGSVIIPPVPEKLRLSFQLPLFCSSVLSPFTPSGTSLLPSSIYASGLQLYANPSSFSDPRLWQVKFHHKSTRSSICCGPLKGEKGGYLRPDVAMAMALQCTLQALMVEEFVLSWCFGVEEGYHHRRYYANRTATRIAGGGLRGRRAGSGYRAGEEILLEPPLSPKLLGLGISPKERRMHQEHQAYLLQECLVEIFGGDISSFSIIDQVQGIGARMLWVGQAVAKPPQALLRRHRRRRNGKSGEDGDGERGSGVWSLSDEDEDGEQEGEQSRTDYLNGDRENSLTDSPNHHVVTNTQVFFNTQRILKQNFLFQLITRLAHHVTTSCDKTYVIPILSMLQSLSTPTLHAAAMEPAPKVRDPDHPAEEEGVGVDMEEVHRDVDDEEEKRKEPPPLQAPTSQSTFAMILLREVESTMAGAMLQHMEEQSSSITRAKKEYCIRPTPLFVGFTNLPLYIYRMEGLMNLLCPHVSENSQYTSIMTTLMDQLFAALDEITGVATGHAGSAGVKGWGVALDEWEDIQDEKDPDHKKKSKKKQKNHQSIGSPAHLPVRLKMRETVLQKFHALTLDKYQMDSNKAKYIQQYRHHAYFCTFFQALSPLSHAAAALQKFYDISAEKRNQYERLYLERVLLLEELPVFGSFTTTAQELLEVYSEVELRHHRAVSVEAVKATVFAMNTEIPKGIERCAERMKQHFLRDVSPDSIALQFHKTLLQRTWQHFCRLMEQQYAFMEGLVQWEIYQSHGIRLGITKSRVFELLGKV